MTEENVMYLEALDEGTNRAIAENLKDEGVTVEDTARETSRERCSDGKVHNLWQCPEIIVSAFIAQKGNSPDCGFKFRVWKKNKDGSITCFQDFSGKTSGKSRIIRKGGKSKMMIF